jgi:SpoVK/Ycf46/Vps4 family AAA+-type ATPase
LPRRAPVAARCCPWSRPHTTGERIKAHRLPPVAADEVILPEATRKLLDRNVLSFADSREGLRALGLQTKKGILLYGPPST